MASFITLISPPKLYSYSARFYVGRGGAPPLNLAYLARAISDAGFDYQVIDSMATNRKYSIKSLNIECHGLELEQIVNTIDPKSQIVGITSMFSNEFMIVRELVKMIKRKYPKKVIVVGGEHPSAMPLPTLKYEKGIDYIFYGESESNLITFLKNISTQKCLKNTPGVYYRDSENEIRQNPSLGRLLKLDDHLPLWDKFPVDFYLENKLSLSRVGFRSMPMLATRGCPYKCTFCSNEQMWGSRYVMRSVDSIIREMKSYVENYKIQHIDFQDLSTSINKVWFIELLEAMKRELPNITWEMTVGTRSEILDEKVLKLLFDSGTTQLTYAPETGSYELSKRIKKKVNFKKLFKSIKVASGLGIEVKCHIIIGFPSESLLDLMKTLMMAMKLGLYGVKGVSIYTFSPYPGSEIFNKLYDQENFTEQEYNNFLNYQLVNSAGARVFSINNFLKYPREEALTLIGNSFMVLCYFLGMLRFPHRLMDLILNPLKSDPKNPLEIGVYNFLKKVNFIK